MQKLLFLFLLPLMPFSFPCHAQTTYRMVTRNYSPVTDSYPQEVSNFKKADSVYYFTVKVSKAYDDTLKRKVAEKVLLFLCLKQRDIYFLRQKNRRTKKMKSNMYFCLYV